jgi:hypothetical protein
MAVAGVPVHRKGLVVIIRQRVILSVTSSEDLRLPNHQHLRWRVLVIVLAVCGLTVSLATRTFRLAIPHGVTARSADSQTMRQHMDRDAAHWAPPVPTLSTLQAPVFYPRVAPAGPPVPGVLFDESLSNRPPPSC